MVCDGKTGTLVLAGVGAGGTLFEAKGSSMRNPLL